MIPFLSIFFAVKRKKPGCINCGEEPSLNEINRLVANVDDAFEGGKSRKIRSERNMPAVMAQHQQNKRKAKRHSCDLAMMIAPQEPLVPVRHFGSESWKEEP